MKRVIFCLLVVAALILTMLPAISYAQEPPYLEVGKSASPNPNCGRATVTLTVTGAGQPAEERLPVDVMLIIDRSESMSTGNKLGDAKAAAQYFITQLDSSKDRVGLVSYSDSAALNQGLTSNFATVNNKINALSSTGGYTNIGAAINTANQELATNGRSQAVLVEILLTDGLPNRPYGGASANFNEASAEYARGFAQAAHDDGITLYTIGLGSSNDPATGISQYFLDDNSASGHTYNPGDPAGHPYSEDGLAFIGGGHFYLAPTSGDLESIFAEISEEITINIAGTDVWVTDVLPDGVNYVSGSAVPAPDSISGQTLKWNLGSISIGDTKTITLDVTFDDLGSQLVDVYPDSRVDYTNYLGNSASKEFDEKSVTVRDCTPTPPGGGGGGGGGAVRYLTVDWEGRNTTKPLDANDRLTEDLLGPSPNGMHSLLLEQGTHVPVVNGTRYYLIVIRKLAVKDIPPLAENTVAIVAFNITPEGAVFHRNIFLTLGLDQGQLPQNALKGTMTIAYYDDVSGLWVPLESEPGESNGVAELALSTAIDHFTIFGVLTKVALPSPSPARFVSSGLSIVTSVEKIWDPVTFVTRTGESVTIAANIANDGGQAGTYTVELKLNGGTVDTQTVTMGAGQSQGVSFTQSGLDYGRYEVEVAGLSGTFTASRTITWWLIIVIIAAIGLISWGVVWGIGRRKAQSGITKIPKINIAKIKAG
jgi:hypothetical protein